MGRKTTEQQSETSKPTTEICRWQRIAAIAALGASAVVSLSACSPNAASAETAPTTVVTPESNSTNPANIPEQGPIISKLEINSGLSASELGQTLVERLQNWDNYGSSPEVIQAWEDADNKNVNSGGPGITIDNFMKDYANRQSVDFGKSLFLDPNNPLVDIQAQINGVNLAVYAQTVDNKSHGSQEGYKVIISTDSVQEISSAGADRTLSINYTFSDNSDKTGGLVHAIGLGKVNSVVVFRDVNGKEKIVSWTTAHIVS